METQEKQIDIVEMAKQHELKMAELYAAYAKNQPHNRDFWEGISQEEISHANAISFLQKEAEEGKIAVKKDRYSQELMNYLFDKTAEALKDAEKGNLSFERTLKIALELEKSMVEKRYFDIFDINNEEVFKTAKKLEKETEGHIKKIEQQLEKETGFSKMFE